MSFLEWDFVNSIVFVVAAMTLFLFALHSFSVEVQSLSETSLKGLLQRLTRNRLSSIVVGALTAAVLQSSSAVSSMIVSLAHARLLTFSGADGLISRTETAKSGVGSTHNL